MGYRDPCDFCGDAVSKRYKRQLGGLILYLCFPCRSELVRHKERKAAKVRKAMPRVRKQLFEERGDKCERCGDGFPRDSLFAHHIFPVVDGGTNESKNLKLLCRKCHGIEHSSDRRWVLRPGQGY